MGFNSVIEMANGKMGIEVTVIKGHIDCALHYRETTKSWDFEGELVT